MIKKHSIFDSAHTTTLHSILLYQSVCSSYNLVFLVHEFVFVPSSLVGVVYIVFCELTYYLFNLHLWICTVHLLIE